MKAKKEKTLVLLDSHAIIHRAYHALPDFESSKGEPTGALYGLSTMLIKIITDLKPNYIIACYDLPSPTHRHEVYEEYKGTRKKIDDELIVQLERSKDLFKAFNIPVYSHKGFEADDVLGTIVEILKDDKNMNIVIASGDMDTLQLVSDDKVRVYTLKKGIKDTIIYNEKAVTERFGFAPTLLPDFKGLRGDPSDNIIGIPGIGEKTASILIQKFGSIEDIYKKIKENEKEVLEVVSPRILDLLKNHKDEALFSKMLGTVRRDAPVDFKLPEHEWKEGLAISDVEKLFKELDFRTLTARVQELISPNIQNINSKQNTEKTGKTGQGKQEKTDKKDIKEKGTLFAEAEKLPEDFKLTALALWVVDSNHADPTLEDVLNFASTDSYEKARDFIFKKLDEGRTREVFENIELPLIPVINAMQTHGVKIDAIYLKKLSLEYHKKLSELEKNIWKSVGEEFNINSPKQMGEVLFTKLGLVPKNQKKTSGGAKSTKESELEKLRDVHPSISMILEYRELQKLLSTYIDSIPEYLGKDSRLHAEFLQTGAVTGRISSKNPNMQNIPIKTELGRNIRNAFIAEKGSTLISLDYSQIELRIAAFLSGDEKLIEFFKSGTDIHTAVAAQVFKVSLKDVDKEMRRKAKVINFGILYGMGVNALKANLGTSRDEAKIFYDEYFKNFSGLATYLEKTKLDAAQKGYTETFFGRRRYFPGIKSKLPFIRAASERMAINAPIQGTSADITKLAMIRVYDYIEKNNLTDKVALIMTVHDELVYEVKESVAKETEEKIKEVMESIVPAKDMAGVPLVVNSSRGENWGDMK